MAPMSKKAESKSCPICRKPPAPGHRPFCSQGCKDRDLLKWLGEGYRIPGPLVPPAGVDSDEGER